MDAMPDIAAVAQTVNLLLLVVACVVLHVRLRNRTSLSILLALAAIVLWTLGAPAIPITAAVVDVPSAGPGTNAREALAGPDEVALPDPVDAEAHQVVHQVVLDALQAADREARPREAIGIALQAGFCVSCLLAAISIPRRRAAG